MNLIPPSTDHRPSLRRALLAHLMRLANAAANDRWYALKRKLLRKYARPDGYDVQCIEAECWECSGRTAKGCRKCNKGIHHITRTALQRWQIDGIVFHVPAWKMSEFEWSLYAADARNVILGRIWHDGIPHQVANEALLWMLLACERKAFVEELLCRGFSRPFGLPMTTLQTVLMTIRHNRATRRFRALVKAEAARHGKPIEANDDDSVPF